MELDQALGIFQTAWDAIKSGHFYEENINTHFDYLLQTLWKTPYQKQIKADILQNLPELLEKTHNLETPPPFIYILITLKDDTIIKKIQESAIFNFVKEMASENSTFNILNLIDTFVDKRIPIESFLDVVIKHINTNMNKSMIEALAYMVSVQHPEYMKKFVIKFVEIAKKDKTLLQEFIKGTGRRAFLELLNLVTPGEAKKLLQ